MTIREIPQPNKYQLELDGSELHAIYIVLTIAKAKRKDKDITGYTELADSLIPKMREELE